MGICHTLHSIGKEMNKLIKVNRYTKYTIGITVLLIIAYFGDEFDGICCKQDIH